MLYLSICYPFAIRYLSVTDPFAIPSFIYPFSIFSSGVGMGKESRNGAERDVLRREATFSDYFVRQSVYVCPYLCLYAMNTFRLVCTQLQGVH